MGASRTDDGRYFVDEEKVPHVKVMLVLIGGGIGAICRYGVNLLAVKLWGSGFPYGTLVVNLVGCTLIGIAFGLIDRSTWMSPSIRLFFITGFLGALTTFSSFAIETINAASAGSYRLAAMNILANNVMGLVLVVVGMRISRLIS